MADSRSLNPTCEDYHSSDSGSDSDSGVVEDFPAARRSSPTSANVAAKRSKSSMDAEKPAAGEKERLPANIDLQSDSGYSSHTAATMSSADSAPSAKSQSPPAAPVNAAPPPPSSPTIKRRPTISKRATDESPRKPLGRSGSVSSRQPRDRRSTITDNNGECTVPNCQCGGGARSNTRGRPRRPEINPISSSVNVSHSDVQSRTSDPAPYYVPQSPSYIRQPAPQYAQGSAVITPATRRRTSSTSRGTRPMSYHGDSGQAYPGWQMPNQLPSPPQDINRGPPPAGSAYWNMNHQPQPHHYGVTNATPPNAYYAQPFFSPPFENPSRPPMPHQSSSTYSARGSRPLSQLGPPVVTQERGTASGNGKGPSARYPDPSNSALQNRFPSAFDQDSSTEYESTSEEEVDRSRARRAARDKALMPPPDIKRRQERRESMSQSMVLPVRYHEPDPKASRVSTTSRTTSRARPPLIKQSLKAQTMQEIPTRSKNRNSQVYVENSTSGRSQSYQGYEQPEELRRKHRDSKLYNPEPVATPTRRRQTDLDPRRRDEELADNMRDIEGYMSKTRGSEDPVADKVHLAAKRASRVISGQSEAGSSRSKNSDSKSRISRSNQTTITNGASGEIRLQVDASAPLRLQFNGDMEGRTLQINPAEGGMSELVIGNSRENTYRSEKGSVVGGIGNRKLIANNARREAEERSSVRSVHSSHSRRDRESRIDNAERRRRRQETEYYDRI